MRQSDGTSWRFSEDVPELLHLALYVRDAAGLPVAVTADLPPRLDGPVPDRSGDVDPADRAAAAEQWTAWWRAAVDAVASLQTAPQPPAGIPPHEAAARAARAAGQALAGVRPEPSEYAALAGSPQLQRVVAALFRDGTRFVQHRRRDLLEHDRPAQFPWVLLSGTAERIAAERHVPITSLRAQALVLMVQGNWSRVHAPGTVLTSLGAARDRTVAGELVAQAFTSALDG